MGWIAVTVMVLILVGMIAGLSSSGHKSETSDPAGERSPVDDDDHMLEDWYTSQELDNDLDDWER